MKQHNYRHVLQRCFIGSDHRRYLLLLILLLCVIMLFHSNSDAFTTTDILENEDVCSQLLRITLHSNRTLCSESADRRGKKQRIISLSIFGPKENALFADDKFSQLMTPLLHEATALFPKWTIRLYADELTISRLNLHNLPRVSKNIDICNVNQIPTLGDVSAYLSGKLWRFLPALDPTVEFVSSRDLDSPLTHREQLVVEEFINSPYLFLTMRDHPLHNVPVLGGLWTGALDRNRHLFLRLFSILLERTRVQRYVLKKDQKLLEELVWSKVKDEALVYDSYMCEHFREGHLRAFPSQRPSRDCHMGCVRPCCQNSSKTILNEPCPEQCRPKDHPEWTYC